MSHLRTPDGKVVNKAAGDNDVGTIIKSQFNPDLRPKTSTFEEQHAREDKQGKRIISHNHSFVLQSGQAGNIEERERSSSRQHKSITTALTQKKNSSYLY